MNFGTLNTGLTGDEVFGTAGTSSSSAVGTNYNVMDRLFGVATDAFGQYLNLKTQTALLKEQNKYSNAVAQQNAVLTTTELPQDVTVRTADFVDAYQVQSSGFSIDNKTLLIGAVAALLVWKFV